MICPICGSNRWTFIRRYLKPDIYESFAGVKEPKCRAWWKCRDCGLYKQSHSYDTAVFKKVYEGDYRSKNFRGESIQRVFDKIISLPEDKSENKARVGWVQQFLQPQYYLLDIGTGLGVFPFELGLTSYVIEPNYDSCNFLKRYFTVHNGFYKPNIFERKMDVISCIHVLEHSEDPEEMLNQFRQDLTPDGKIFIEVPDAKEFDYLPDDHDEFNSTHIHFFSPDNLYRLVECCNYTVTDMHMVRTNERDLSRIMLVAKGK